MYINCVFNFFHFLCERDLKNSNLKKYGKGTIQIFFLRPHKMSFLPSSRPPHRKTGGFSLFYPSTYPSTWALIRPAVHYIRKLRVLSFCICPFWTLIRIAVQQISQNAIFSFLLSWMNAVGNISGIKSVAHFVTPHQCAFSKICKMTPEIFIVL